MIFEKDYLPQFRESDHDGLIGAKGYFAYFQDMATHYMHNLGLGNDTLPEQYGISWVYTKYKLQILKKADYTGPLHMETWAEPDKNVRICQDILFFRNQEIYARGRLESCLADLKGGRLCKLSEIDFPKDAEEEKKLELADFCRLKKQTDDMELMYSRPVYYTDLDKSLHMNNLHYVNLFLDGLNMDFYENHSLTGMEIHFLKQCYEKENIKILGRRINNIYEMAALKEDSSVAAICQMEFRE